ncbi:hypothetical protein HOLleu_22475 [Holothuria leucospilota]|uniref:Peptidase A2 domain-containing protein n=1 Tax=Holothuria leucospilota TaxID=206669 RepID=A0A9Q1H7J2_HOLLE|nr:hypothetical protein HOLleu_22475 [Holothuria leucospilota]
MDYTKEEGSDNPEVQRTQNRKGMVGGYINLDIKIAVNVLQGILDTGLQVTTISEKFARTYLHQLEKPREDFLWLNLKAANGLSIPLSGYIEADVKVMGTIIPKTGILILKNEPAPGIPCLLGMNIIQHVRDNLFKAQGKQYVKDLKTDNTGICQIFNKLEKSYGFTGENGKMGYVRIVSRKSMFNSPRQEVIITGRCRMGPNGEEYEALTEPCPNSNMPQNVLIAKTLGVVRGGRVPVRLVNPYPFKVRIKRSTKLGIVSQVDTVEEPEITIESTEEGTFCVGVNL